MDPCHRFSFYREQNLFRFFDDSINPHSFTNFSRLYIFDAYNSVSNTSLLKISCQQTINVQVLSPLLINLFEIEAKRLDQASAMNSRHFRVLCVHEHSPPPK